MDRINGGDVHCDEQTGKWEADKMRMATENIWNKWGPAVGQVHQRRVDQ